MEDLQGSQKEAIILKNTGATDSPCNVHAHNAPAFRRIQAVLFTDQGHIGFPGDGMGGSDGLPFQSSATARGTPRKTVPRFLNSWRIRAGLALMIFGRVGPTRVP